MTAKSKPTAEPQLPVRAGVIKARLRAGSESPDYLPARMVNEFVYCPRLFYYEWVEGIFAHSADTVDGAARHTRVDAPSNPLPDAGALSDAAEVTARGVQLSSEVHGLTAKMVSSRPPTGG